MSGWAELPYIIEPALEVAGVEAMAGPFGWVMALGTALYVGWAEILFPDGWTHSRPHTIGSAQPHLIGTAPNWKGDGSPTKTEEEDPKNRNKLSSMKSIIPTFVKRINNINREPKLTGNTVRLMETKTGQITCNGGYQGWASICSVGSYDQWMNNVDIAAPTAILPNQTAKKWFSLNPIEGLPASEFASASTSTNTDQYCLEYTELEVMMVNGTAESAFVTLSLHRSKGCSLAPSDALDKAISKMAPVLTTAETQRVAGNNVSYGIPVKDVVGMKFGVASKEMRTTWHSLDSVDFQIPPGQQVRFIYKLDMNLVGDKQQLVNPDDTGSTSTYEQYPRGCVFLTAQAHGALGKSTQTNGEGFTYIPTLVGYLCTLKHHFRNVRGGQARHKALYTSGQHYVNATKASFTHYNEDEGNVEVLEQI